MERHRINFLVPIVAILIASCKVVSEHHVVNVEQYHINSESELDVVLEKLSRDPLSISLNQLVWEYHSKTQQYERGIEFASKVFHAYPFSQSENLRELSAFYLMNMYYYSNKTDSVKIYVEYLLNRPNIGLTSQQEMAMYNMAAIYYITSDLDYAHALELFQKSYELAKKYEDTIGIRYACNNISTLYFLRKDTSGLRFALEAHSLASKDPNEYAVSAVTVSTMYLLKGNYEEAYFSINESIEDIHLLTRENEALVLSNYADILLAQRKYRKAADINKNALEICKNMTEVTFNNNISICIHIYLSLGKAHLGLGEYLAAISDLNNAEKLSVDYLNKEYLTEIYEMLSEINIKLNNESEALKYFKLHREAYRDAYDFQKELKFRNLFMENERFKHKEELSRKELELTRSKLSSQFAIFVVILLVLILGFIYFLYRRRNSMYAELVRNYDEQRKKLNEKIRLEREKKDSNPSELLVIFEKLEELMKNEKVFREKKISRDSLCEMLGTNTTYLTNAVNKYYKKSITSYINTYRIDDVICALSDINNTDSIQTIFEKAGFSSRTTSIRSFKQEVGCIPTIYREEMKRKQARR